MSLAPVVSASSIGLIVDESGDRIVLEEDLQEEQELVDQLVSAAFLGDLAGVTALAHEDNHLRIHLHLRVHVL